MTLAIFDLDNTLIAGDSDHLWGEFLCDQGIVDGDNFRSRNDGFYADYQQGTLDIDAYLRFVLEPLTGKRPEELQALQAQFMDTCIESLMQPAASRLIDSHRYRGHRPLIITATNEFITRPIADRLGIPDLLGCQFETRDGRITGEPMGTLTYREGKVTRLHEWLEAEQESMQDAWFYSDSHNDLPLLELVDHPIAVDPDDQLAATARERGWQIISLRD